jgi:acyl-CoA thioester hydrolase
MNQIWALRSRLEKQPTDRRRKPRYLWDRALVRIGGLDFRGPLLPLCAESHCTFKREISYPDTVEAGLRVVHIGRSSIRYEIGLFREGESETAADAWFVHVFVSREDRKPQALPAALRQALESIKTVP